MNIYLITRNCAKQSPSDPRTGPPIAMYRTDAEAQFRLADWQTENKWDGFVYRIVEFPVIGNANLQKDDTLYVVLQCCEDIPDCVDRGSTCGPPKAVCYTKDDSIDFIQTWRQANPSKQATFHIKPMELKGLEERRKSDNFICRLLHRS